MDGTSWIQLGLNITVGCGDLSELYILAREGNLMPICKFCFLKHLTNLVDFKISKYDFIYS
jgi:hypothetical protein